MSKREDWDKQYLALLKEEEEAHSALELTAAVICGRLSVVESAKRAHDEGVEFDEFLAIMEYVTQQELTTGKIDEYTFKIPEDFAHDNEGEPGV